METLAVCKSVVIISLIIISSSGIFTQASNDTSNNYHIHAINCDTERWNVKIPLTANRVSDVCNAVIEIRPGLEAVGPRSQFDIYLILSMVSNEVSSADIALFRSKQVSSGYVVLYNFSYTAKDLTSSSILLDVKNVSIQQHLNNTCGQMFLVAAGDYRTGIDNKSSPSFMAWPFQVACESDVDLAVVVEIKSYEPFTGVLSENFTLIPGSSLTQRLPGLRVMLMNTNSSKSDLLKRSSPSMPIVWAYITSQKHSTLFKSTPTYKRLQLRLGDVILHLGSQLINLQPSQFYSPAFRIGQMIELNTNFLQLKTTAVCGEAWLVFLLEMDDLNVENNFVVIPVYIDCWSLPELMGSNLGSCSVIPDEYSNGKFALMYTTGQPYGVGIVNAFQYKTDEKSFLFLRATDTQHLTEIPSKYRTIQLERDLLVRLNHCPSKMEFRLPFQDTLFGQLHDLIQEIDSRWIPLNGSNQQKQEQEEIKFIGQALKVMFKASTIYSSIPAYFMDNVLNGLYSYWPFFPFGVSSSRTNTSDSTTNSSTKPWHDRFAKVVVHFMRQHLFSELGGQPNPDQALQSFLNQLIWSPNILQSSSLPNDSVQHLRQFLIMVLEKRLPRTLDNLPLEIGNALSNFSTEVMSPLPIKETQVQSAVSAVRSAIDEAMNNISSLSRLQSTNSFALVDQLAVIRSFCDVFKDTSIIKRLTLLIQKIQESANLNQQWILMDGMSDTSLDAEYSCRLRAVDRINFRLKPKADKLLENLNLITFWKTDSNIIYRGDISSITGRLYWNRIAVCYCNDDNNRPKNRSRAEMP